MRIILTEGQIRKIVDFELTKDIKRRYSVRNLPLGTKIKNAEDTGNDDPPLGDSWIEYWKMYTGNHVPERCPMCGRSFTNDNKAEGCHIKIYNNGNISEKKFIIPGHHNCNTQFGQDFALQSDVETVEVI